MTSTQIEPCSEEQRPAQEGAEGESGQRSGVEECRGADRTQTVMDLFPKMHPSRSAHASPFPPPAPQRRFVWRAGREGRVLELR